MLMLKKTVFMAAALAAALILQAQERYVVQIGNFMEARAEDFSGLRSIGFVYAAPVEAGIMSVMLGGYDSKDAADRAVAQVRGKGYPSAYARQVFLREGTNVAVIQLGTEKASSRINWERYAAAGDLYGIMGAGDLRVVTGPFASMDEARKRLDGIRKAGFKDAFSRAVNSMTLHRLAEFETGIKKPLLQLNIQTETPAPQASIPVIPPDYDMSGIRIRSPESAPATPQAQTIPVIQTRSGNAGAPGQLPAIRGNVRRRSALELQQALKAEGVYTGPLDGLYGGGTTNGYNAFAGSNRQMLRYRALAGTTVRPGLSPAAARLQRALDAMPDDPAAVVEVTTSGGALAKAYQAYVLFTNRGPSTEINQLMNTAIKEAFEGKAMRKAPPFDTRATYAYNNLDQLLLHLHYLHSAPGNAVTAPCWLTQRHPAEMARVYETYAGNADGDFPFRGCDQLSTWPEVAIMTAMAQNWGGNTAEDAAATAKRAKLFNAPAAPKKDDDIVAENWNIRVWKGLDSWAQRDPLNQDLIKAFRVAYHQSQVRLEDHFMDKGFNAEAARTLALSTLQTLAGHHLQRFL